MVTLPVPTGHAPHNRQDILKPTYVRRDEQKPGLECDASFSIDTISLVGIPIVMVTWLSRSITISSTISRSASLRSSGGRLSTPSPILLTHRKMLPPKTFYSAFMDA